LEIAMILDGENQATEAAAAHVEERYIAGDLKDTYSRIYLDQTTGSVQAWQQESGDGTVVLASASNGRAGRTDPAFVGHQIIFSDNHVITLIKHTLDVESGRFRPYAAPVEKIRGTDGELINL
jgi:hypothetical protein